MPEEQGEVKAGDSQVTALADVERISIGNRLCLNSATGEPATAAVTAHSGAGSRCAW